MTDFGELATLGNRLQEAELEIARLRSELVDTTTELRHARDEELDAEFYQSQIDDVWEFFLCWRGSEGDEMMKFADSVLAMLRSVVVPDWHASDDRLDKQTILGDRLRLAMAFGRELAEERAGRIARDGWAITAFAAAAKNGGYLSAEECQALPKTPEPKQCPPIPGVDQNRPLSQDEKCMNCGIKAESDPGVCLGCGYTKVQQKCDPCGEMSSFLTEVDGTLLCDECLSKDGGE